MNVLKGGIAAAIAGLSLAVQAAVLLPKLKALKDYEIDRRQEVAGRYNAAFCKGFTVPFVAEGCVSAWAQYAILAKDTQTRDKVIAHLKEKNIPNMVYYPTPQHALPVFKAEPHYGESYKNADDYCARTLSLLAEILPVLRENDCSSESR